MTTALWSLAILLTVVFAVLLFIVWMRKLHFDRIHHNFLDLEDAFGGEVVRGGFAVRPRYRGTFEGRPFSVSITSGKSDRKRLHYIGVSMQLKSPTTFSILSDESLKDVDVDAERRKRMLPILDDRYHLEVKARTHLAHLDVEALSRAVAALDPFGYILVGRTNTMMERLSQTIFEDTRLDAMRPLLEGLSHLQKALAR